MGAKPSVIITAGYNHSPVAGALLQLLPRDGVNVTGIVLVRAAQFSRLSKELRRRGLTGVVKAAAKALGATPDRASATDEDDPIANFYAAQSLRHAPLSELSSKHGIPLHRTSSLNNLGTVEWLKGLHADGALYCGGGIIRERFLTALNGKVLNGHAGPLPNIRGMNAMEWSVLLRLEPRVTVHFIDLGIDTGPVVGAVPITVEPIDGIERLRQKSLVATILGLRENISALGDEVPPRNADADAYRQVYSLAPALLSIAEARLAEAVRS